MSSLSVGIIWKRYRVIFSIHRYSQIPSGKLQYLSRIMPWHLRVFSLVAHLIVYKFGLRLWGEKVSYQLKTFIYLTWKSTTHILIINYISFSQKFPLFFFFSPISKFYLYNPDYTYIQTGRRNAGEQPWWKESWSRANWTWVSNVPRQPGRPTVSRGASSIALPTYERSDSPTLHCTGVTSPWVLCAVLGTTVQKGQKLSECRNEGYKDGEESRREGIWEVVKVPSFVQPRKEMSEEGSHRGLQLFIRGRGGSVLISSLCWPAIELKGKAWSYDKGRVRLDIRKRFYTERMVVHWNRLPREVIMALNLLEFKKHLDDALSHMVWSVGGPVWI